MLGSGPTCKVSSGPNNIPLGSPQPVCSPDSEDHESALLPSFCQHLPRVSQCSPLIYREHFRIRFFHLMGCFAQVSGAQGQGVPP